MLVVDDEALVRHAFGFFVNAADDMDVVGEAQDGKVALTMARSLRPDVVLMDIQMPVMDGVAATHAITQELPETRVVAVTTFTTTHYVVPALRAGASGYLLKDSAPDELIDTIRAVHQGEYVLARQIVGALVDTVRQDSAPEPPSPAEALPALTAREADVVQLIAEGLSNRQIAQRMAVSEATVKTHLGSVLHKWDVRDRTQVLIAAVRSGLVTLT
ncbi:response regulator [Salana multivorans]